MEIMPGKQALAMSPKKIMVLVVTFAIMMVLTLYGWSTACFGMFIIGVLLYMIPHMVGVGSVRFLTVYGVAFFVLALLFGSFIYAPHVVDSIQSEPVNDDNFTNITYDYDPATETMTVYADVTISGEEKPYVYVGHISGIGYTGSQVFGTQKKYEMTNVSGNTYSYSVTGFKTSDLNSLTLALVKDGSILKNTRAWLIIDQEDYKYDGDTTMVCVKGVFNCLLYSMIIYFVLLFASAFMRRKLVATREKMEAEGRLYPQGYGRCDSCGAIILPGEVNCRKCGAYIDRPEEMKPKKADFFTCSECGAEVPMTADSCPKCGAVFDEELETEVIHADGTVEITEVNIICPGCGEEIPSTASFCPKCGQKNGRN